MLTPTNGQNNLAEVDTIEWPKHLKSYCFK